MFCFWFFYAGRFSTCDKQYHHFGVIRLFHIWFLCFFNFFCLAVSSYYNSSFYFLALQSRGSGPKFSASLFPAKHFSQGRRLASVHMNLHHFVCQVELNLYCPCSASSFFLFICSLFTNIWSFIFGAGWWVVFQVNLEKFYKMAPDGKKKLKNRYICVEKTP